MRESKKKEKEKKGKTLNPNGHIVCVWIQLNPASTFNVFQFFFFFFLCVNSNLTWVYCVEDKITIHTLFITIHGTVHAPKNIKNGSHDTIHTFKNYFVTVLSVFSF